MGKSKNLASIEFPSRVHPGNDNSRLTGGIRLLAGIFYENLRKIKFIKIIKIRGPWSSDDEAES